MPGLILGAFEKLSSDVSLKSIDILKSDLLTTSMQLMYCSPTEIYSLLMEKFLHLSLWVYNYE